MTSQEPVHVHVVNHPPQKPARKPRSGTARTVTLDNTTGTQPFIREILGRTPHRKRVSLTFIGQSTDLVTLAFSRADAQHLEGALIMCGPTPTVITNGEEIWVAVAAGVSIKVGVVADYEAH